ncbi:MAG TPA: NAD(P)/FAD-dependent oxidoreductase [Gemmatimonadaceae bacterium]|nr:NAD(P)/FAD-dependent oxidoreductase [Gemmatimonadaceae bacterium]
MSRPRVVVIGGGFGGWKAARRLKRADVDITLIDRSNHHTFQPLLYQVATATLAPSDIATPIRWMFRHQKNIEVLMAEVTRIDLAAKTVEVDHGFSTIPYDFLVLATGSRHSYFGHPEWEAIAPGLKSLDDARVIRNRYLSAFEAAERTDDPAERQSLMTFVIVGGGPTGCELAGIIAPVSRKAFRREFHNIDTRQTKVILLEGTDRILPGFPDSLWKHALHDLRQLGVDVRLGERVTKVTPEAVYVGDERIPTRNVFWAAGNEASHLGKDMGVPVDRQGRVEVLPDLSVPGHPEVFVVGDLAISMKDDKKTPVPGVAPAAMQSGWLAGGNILASLAGRPRKPFHYFNKGDLATLGRHKAIANFGFLRVTGFLAWYLWLFVHIMYLAGFRNRLSVLIEWAYAYFTYERGSRIISRSAGPIDQPVRAEPINTRVASASRVV